ncbi:hypothetical protein ACFY15_00465 [Streptomyces sp. NPDC001373]|uniref:hypothetical protein n=1 Tax=Streptomyces sp. NPDC001373 TaxID=3364565 RepID=UPI0036CC6F62
MADRPITPSGCQHCGIPTDEHGRQWLSTVGVHVWEPPTDRQILARMQMRRAFQLQLLDAAGATFIDGREYRDRYGDTWRAVSDGGFEFVAWVDGRTVASAARRGPTEPPLITHYGDARSVVRSSGPMTLISTLEDQ